MVKMMDFQLVSEGSAPDVMS